MVPVLIAVVAVLAVVVAISLWRRRRAQRRARALRDEEIRAQLTTGRRKTDPQSADPATTRGLFSDGPTADPIPRSNRPAPDPAFPWAVDTTPPVDGPDAEATDPWDVVETPLDLTDDKVAPPPGRDDGREPEPPADDPLGPPAAVHMTVTGTHPWAPARLFLTELKAEGYETTVELPDLVVMRDPDRMPVTVREPAGPPGRLIITSTPEKLPTALELLVRSLLAAAFTLDATDGRDVKLTDDVGTEVRLTVTQLSRV